MFVGVLPPMRELIEVVLTEAARDAGTVSILGAIALIWGTSRFVVAFEGALARVMGGDRAARLLAQNLVALGAVVLMVAAIPASSVAVRRVAFLEAAEALGVIPFAGDAAAPGARPAAGRRRRSGATILVYRLVPAPAPRWRRVVVPGIAVGLALTILARVFVFLAPRLIGAAALLGTLATVFAALAWLALSFQAILLGAAWVRDRVERAPPGATPIE